MNQPANPANPSNPKPEKQPKTTPSKMATQLLLFFQIKKNTEIRDRAPLQETKIEFCFGNSGLVNLVFQSFFKQ